MKKIMFNDKFLLTKAVLDGRKTQTRRICKEQIWAHSDIVNAENGIFHFEIPKYKVGEVVAVAQSYKELDTLYNAAFNRKHSVHGMTLDMLDCVPDWEIKKWFDIRKQFAKKASWKNKMFVKAELMPHQIRITDVRVGRLQDISEEDCLKEGITDMGAGGSLRCSFTENVKQTTGDIIPFSNNFATAQEAFAHLINKVSRKGTWESNPYVFVYEFELVK